MDCQIAARAFSEAALNPNCTGSTSADLPSIREFLCCDLSVIVILVRRIAFELTKTNYV